ncbi:MAG TPA: C-terminal binding protein [Deinococcales bacterium]|nr:C-terminal binding protein [Deinococcales bacterium]
MTSRGLVFVTDWDYPSLDIERAVLARAGLELTPTQCRSEDDVLAACADAEGLLNQYAPLTRRVLEGLRHLKVVTRYGVGYDTVDVQAATELGIAVCNVPDYGVEEVSDHAIALILGLARGIARHDRAIRSGAWDFSLARPLRRTRGKTLGVLGYGRIGRATARKGAGLGWQVIACDPAQAAGPEPVELVGFEELLERADYLSIHLPLTQQTRGLIDAAALARLKPGAILVNTARGGIVDTEALTQALLGGRLAGAGLDVLDREPIAPGSPLLELENCILTPHAAWYSEDAFVELKTKAAEEVASVLTGRTPRYCLNPEVLSREVRVGV